MELYQQVGSLHGPCTELTTGIQLRLQSWIKKEIIKTLDKNFKCDSKGS